MVAVGSAWVPPSTVMVPPPTIGALMKLVPVMLCAPWIRTLPLLVNVP